MPATSEKQKRFFGAVMGAKKGQKGVSGAAKEAAKGMSKTQIKHFLKTEEDAETPIDSDKVPLWWLKGIFPERIPLEQQKQRLKKVIALLKLQSPDGSMKHNAGSIAFNYGIRGGNINKIIDVFAPERKTWPKRGHLRRAQAKSVEQNEQIPTKITQKDILAQVRKPMPPSQKVFDKSDKKRYDRKKFKDFFKDKYNY